MRRTVAVRAPVAHVTAVITYHMAGGIAFRPKVGPFKTLRGRIVYVFKNKQKQRNFISQQ